MIDSMTEKTQPNHFNLFNFIADLIGGIWGTHILIAALLYPRPLLPTETEIGKQLFYKIFSFSFGTLLMLIDITSIIAMFTRPTWIEAGKVVFVFLNWLIIGVIYIVFNHLRDIYEVFSILEEEAIQGRDQSVMLIRAGQAALQAGNKKLLLEENVEMSFYSLLNKVGPLAFLFLRKEKNIFQIGIEAFKLFFIGSRMFKNLF